MSGIKNTDPKHTAGRIGVTWITLRQNGGAETVRG
jgi:hypothetical protein